ncbi:MAG: hypothetical protein WBH13_04250 [Parasynechococcus sp.]
MGTEKICGSAAGNFNATQEGAEPLLAQLTVPDQENRPDGGLLHTVGSSIDVMHERLAGQDDR